MDELEELLTSLAKLEEESKDAFSVDEAVNRLVLLRKRSLMGERLNLLMQDLIKTGLKTASLNSTDDKSIIVESAFRVLQGRDDAREGHFPTVYFDPQTDYYIDLYRNEWLDWMDGKERRSIYLDEFRERCKITMKAIHEGKLDDQFGLEPREILHKIMGRRGELLTRLGINPEKGRTLKYLKEILEASSKQTPKKNRVI